MCGITPGGCPTGTLSPEIDNSRLEKDIWFPVVDIAIDHEAEGVLVYRNWLNLSCTYTSGFFGLAALEELKLTDV